MTPRPLVGFAGALVLAALLPATARSAAQQPPAAPPPSPANTVVSPEVLSDGRVVFRIFAPSATEVAVRGEFA